MKKHHPLVAEAEKIKDWLVKIRRDFHQHPELGMEEHRTRKKIIRYLEEMGIGYISVANTGIVAIIRGNQEGKTIALRGDMDALPIEDQKEVSYKSLVKGKMHACGHDAHTTILLGAANLLNKKKDLLKGNVKLFFQPAEETVGGAKPMIKAGCMENPKVAMVFGLHVSSDIPVGEIGIKYGQMNASSDTIKIILQGKSSHGAYPHTGIDAIAMAGQVITALHSIVSRNIDPRNAAVVTIGTIQGGTQGNIIADRVELVGTVRTLDSITRERVIDKIDKIVTQVAMAYGGTGGLIREAGYAPLINDSSAVEIVKKSGEDILGEENIHTIDQPSLGVEDFAYFAQAAPAAFYRLGCRNEVKGIIHEAHNGFFDIDEDCLVLGTAMQVNNVLLALGGKTK